MATPATTWPRGNDEGGGSGPAKAAQEAGTGAVSTGAAGAAGSGGSRSGSLVAVSSSINAAPLHYVAGDRGRRAASEG